MPNEIYHRSEWGNPKPLGWGNIYFDADATNKLYKHSDNYENSDGTDKILRDIPNKASIVLTPTAYSDGSLNTVIPPYQVLPQELVTNGDFSDGTTDWANTRGSTITALNNVLTVSSSETLAGAAARQVIATEIGKKYKWEFTINEANNTRVGVRNGTSDFGFGTIIIDIRELGVGRHTYTFEAIGTSVSILLGTMTLNNQEKYSNVSVKEVQEADFDFSRGSSATRVNEKGLIEDVASGIPRIDYTSGFGSWLLEPQSQNTSTYSNDFTQGIIFNSSSQASLTNSVLTSNQATSPNGANDAWLFKDDNSGGSNSVFLNYFNTQVNSNDNNVISIFVKKALSNNFFGIQVNGFDSSADGNSYFNIKDGTLGTINGNHTAKIEDYGNGWYRCSITFQTTTDTTGAVRFRVATLDNQPNVQLDGTNGVYLFGLQCEASATQNYVTSYIPTSGSIATRSADVANNSGNADLFNNSEGVLYAEIAALADDLTNRVISISDSSNDNAVTLRFKNNTNQLNFQVRANDVAEIFRNITVSDITEFAKVAFKYKSGESSVFINGTEVVTMGQTFTFTNTLNQLRFESASTAEDFYGKTKELAVFKEALTDAELETLTSWVSFTQMATDLEYTLE